VAQALSFLTHQATAALDNDLRRAKVGFVFTAITYPQAIAV
jgi:hypothetical protein